MSNIVLEQINQVLVNLVWTCNITQHYVDKDFPWTGILAAAAFEIHLTIDSLNRYSTETLIFGQDMIILIKHTVDY